MHVILNRRARDLRTETPLYRALVRSARDAGAELYETSSFDDLERVAHTIAGGHDSGAVVLAGGDGSYMAGLSALDRAFRARGAGLPDVALAPGGTVGTVARNWGRRGPAVPYAERLLRDVAARTGVRTERPTLRVKDGAGSERVGFIFGTGLVAQFFDLYYASPSQGYGGAARIVARIFVSSFAGGATARRVLTPVACTVAIDGREHPARAYSLVVASVVENLGLHMHVLYRATERPDRVHLVASPLGARRLGPQMPLVLAGKRLLGKDHVDELVQYARITFTGAFDAYVLDGDVLHAPWIELSTGPRIGVLTCAERKPAAPR